MSRLSTALAGVAAVVVMSGFAAPTASAAAKVHGLDATEAISVSGEAQLIEWGFASAKLLQV
jgi:hypothetical protein